ncbi:MAG: SDR family oxidoreductase [Pseudomonadales bacterium]
MPKTALITGSASGIGLGLAGEFYKRGYQVLITDINGEAAIEAATKLGSSDPSRVLAVSCDVTDHIALDALWRVAVERFGQVDIWINNAGRSGTQAPIAGSDPQALCATISANVNGVVLGTRCAVIGMRAQGHGAIYNMAGFGVDGFIRPNMTIYGTSKRAVGYFSKCVAKEVEGSGVTLGWINPGMVITPMVIEGAHNMSEEDWAAGRKVWNLFGQTAEDTAVALVDRIEADNKNGTFIKLLSSGRMLRGFLFGFIKKRDVMSQYGV